MISINERKPLFAALIGPIHRGTAVQKLLADLLRNFRFRRRKAFVAEVSGLAKLGEGLAPRMRGSRGTSDIIVHAEPRLQFPARTLAWKRLFDVAVASLLLLCAAPVLLAAAAHIRLSSPGPVLFRQSRVGRSGRAFTILKLRTMQNRRGGERSTVTSRHDPRLIRGGRWLRKYKIDELPQLLNVLNGSMSLVGPRPTVREDVLRMSPEQVQRLLVRPGLTGLAQIRGNTALTWPKRITLDLQYVRSLTLAVDLRIIAETAAQVFSGRADTHPAGEDEWRR